MVSVILHGTVILAVTGTPVAFAAQETWVDWLNGHALLMNHGPVKLGASTVTCDGTATDGRSVTPSEEIYLGPYVNLGDLYAVGRAGDKIEWVANSIEWMV